MASPVVGTGYNFKVVLLGEGCVGKTSVALRYVEDKFNDKHITTLQVNRRICTSRYTIHISQISFLSLLVFISIREYFFRFGYI